MRIQKRNGLYLADARLMRRKGRLMCRDLDRAWASGTSAGRAGPRLAAHGRLVSIVEFPEKSPILWTGKQP